MKNLTPHAIVIRTTAGDITLPPSGQVARVSSTPGALVSLDFGDGPVTVAEAPSYGPVTGLPDEDGQETYLVSGLVLGRCVGRRDVFGPGTGPNDEAIREDGKIIAVTRLIAAPQRG